MKFALKDFKELLGEIFSSDILAPHKIKVLNIDETFSDSCEVTYVALDYDGHELPKRDFKIRETFKQGIDIGHGRVLNPTNVLADIIQHIIVGELAKHMIEMNKPEVDKRSIVLKAIMERYGGLETLICQLRDDPDVAYVNLEDDISEKGHSLELDEIEDEVQAIVR